MSPIPAARSRTCARAAARSPPPSTDTGIGPSEPVGLLLPPLGRSHPAVPCFKRHAGGTYPTADPDVVSIARGAPQPLGLAVAADERGHLRCALRLESRLARLTSALATPARAGAGDREPVQVPRHPSNAAITAPTIVSSSGTISAPGLCSAARGPRACPRSRRGRCAPSPRARGHPESRRVWRFLSSRSQFCHKQVLFRSPGWPRVQGVTHKRSQGVNKREAPLLAARQHGVVKGSQLALSRAGIAQLGTRRAACGRKYRGCLRLRPSAPLPRRGMDGDDPCGRRDGAALRRHVLRGDVEDHQMAAPRVEVIVPRESTAAGGIPASHVPEPEPARHRDRRPHPGDDVPPDPGRSEREEGRRTTSRC